MNKQIRIVLLVACVFSLDTAAQGYAEATPEQKKVMLEKITASTKQLKSLVCDFEQTKELSILNEKMVSKGKMFYRSDNCVRWEYTSPYTYTFVFNNNKVLMQTGNNRSVIDVKSNNLFQEIVKIMISSINGSGLTDSKSFSTRFFQGTKGWMVALTPQQKEVKQMFSLIKLYFNLTDYSVDCVCMEEKNGDQTIIQLSKKQTNERIENDMFRVD